MPLETVYRAVCRRPTWVVVGWAIAVIAIGLAAPDLTNLVAQSPAELLPADAESARATALVRSAWPDHAHLSTVVVVLHRRGGLTDSDRAYACGLAGRFEKADRPDALREVLGPGARPEVAARLVSRDGTIQLVMTGLATSFVSPVSFDAIHWLQARAAEAPHPVGLDVSWTGDAVIGRDQIRNVRISLDRAAVVTVALLAVVLLIVYRSAWLALIPLATVGVSLVIARGILAWMLRAGWGISMLTELFLVVILFGCGTDLCLLVSWRFREQWDGSDPAGAMIATLRRSAESLLTSAGTVIVGLSLMGTTRFKLFNSTGPSVALGLALTAAAALTLAPALLVLLARYRPQSFDRLAAAPTRFWERIGSEVLARPVPTVVILLTLMAGPALLGLRTDFVYDMLAEQPSGTKSVEALRLIAAQFGAGSVVPLTIVIEAEGDLRQPRGLALIDEISRFLARQRRLTEVRSATQPLGTSAPVDRARLAARLGAVSEGLETIADGGRELEDVINRKAIALRLRSGLKHLAGAVGLRRPGEGSFSGPVADDPATAALLDDLARAAAAARQLGEGGRRAREAVDDILADSYARSLLAHLLITTKDRHQNPRLREALDAYISPDGRRARIDVDPADLVFSAEAINTVDTLRARLTSFLSDDADLGARALVTGINAEWADIRAQSRTDQHQLWVLVPLGVFLILLVAFRDPRSCLNMVSTMVLTYAVALGITHLVFVTGLGAEGLDWKVPYFLFILLVAVGVDYNVFVMARVGEESQSLGLHPGIVRAVARTGSLITSAAAINACSFASFLTSPLSSIRQLGLALVVGIALDAALVRPVLVPCGHWLINRRRDRRT
jgi:RND superfamily putative drug exporter